MIIDLIGSNDEGILRYESDHAPRINETITYLTENMEFRVVSVDYLLALNSSTSGVYTQMATVSVVPVTNDEEDEELILVDVNLLKSIMLSIHTLNPDHLDDVLKNDINNELDELKKIIYGIDN